ncbi:MAG: DUF1565 domain-containing protein [Verrucomicrobia bacterium]|nr:DUF1565 domain-containing protein [Verrucomicrobiota bacterium]MDE3098017.1 DUF1565 domain-containing protein [Verrucomicrobiota bacterium]
MACLATVAARGADFYVSPSGSDSAPGSRLAPWRTIQKAWDTALPGSTIILLPGVYTNAATTRRDGTSSASITLQGEPGAVVGKNLTLQNSHQRVAGLAFQRSKLIFLSTNANWDVVESNVFYNGKGCIGLNNDLPRPYSPVFGPAYDDIRFNVFSNAYGVHVVLNGGHHDVVESNLFTSTTGWDAMRVWGFNQVIRGNIFTNFTSNLTNSQHTDIIQTFGKNGNEASNILFGQNWVLNCKGTQLGNLEQDGVANICDWTFQNNVIANSHAQINIYIPRCNFYNNTFWRCNANLILQYKSKPWRKSPKTVETGTGNVLNNLFIDCGNPPANPKYGRYSGGRRIWADYNMLAGPGGSAKNIHESHGINGGNPRFVNPQALDFRLLPNSPARGRGIPIPGVTNDITGASRLGAPFGIGAFSYRPLSGPTFNTNH